MWYNISVENPDRTLETIVNQAMHIKTRVLPGHKIEIMAPELVEGELVDVSIMVPDEMVDRTTSVLDILAASKAPGLFKTAQEVDDYIQKERDSWDR